MFKKRLRLEVIMNLMSLLRPTGCTEKLELSLLVNLADWERVLCSQEVTRQSAALFNHHLLKQNHSRGSPYNTG